MKFFIAALWAGINRYVLFTTISALFAYWYGALNVWRLRGSGYCLL